MRDVDRLLVVSVGAPEHRASRAAAVVSVEKCILTFGNSEGVV